MRTRRTENNQEEAIWAKRNPEEPRGTKRSPDCVDEVMWLHHQILACRLIKAVPPHKQTQFNKFTPSLSHFKPHDQRQNKGKEAMQPPKTKDQEIKPSKVPLTLPQQSSSWRDHEGLRGNMFFLEDIVPPWFLEALWGGPQIHCRPAKSPSESSCRPSGATACSVPTPTITVKRTSLILWFNKRAWCLLNKLCVWNHKSLQRGTNSWGKGGRKMKPEKLHREGQAGYLHRMSFTQNQDQHQNQNEVLT